LFLFTGFLNSFCFCFVQFWHRTKNYYFFTIYCILTGKKAIKNIFVLVKITLDHFLFDPKCFFAKLGLAILYLGMIGGIFKYFICFEDLKYHPIDLLMRSTPNITLLCCNSYFIACERTFFLLFSYPFLFCV
jgi:hypothetical protein